MANSSSASIVVTRTLIWKTENASLQHIIVCCHIKHENQHLPIARDQLQSFQEFHCQQLQSHLPCQHGVPSFPIEYNFPVSHCKSLSAPFLLTFLSIHWHRWEPFTVYGVEFLVQNILMSFIKAEMFQTLVQTAGHPTLPSEGWVSRTPLEALTTAEALHLKD